MARILIINGQHEEAELLSRGLITHGFETSIARNALEARVALRKSSYDLAIINIQLPDLDAFTFVESAGELVRDLPSILTTAYPDAATVARAVASGFQSVIAKPYRLDALIERVRQITNS